MNISPVSIMKNIMSFKSTKVDTTPKPHIDTTGKKDNEVVAYASMGSDYVFPVTAGQVRIYQNEAPNEKGQKHLEYKVPSAELEGETLDEYLERKKIEWSM